MRILLAEDDPEVRSVIAQVLKDEGHDVVEACDGVQALQILEGDTPPGIVLLDWQLPRLDGIGVIQRSMHLRLAVPLHLMILTGLAGVADAVEALDAGADDYMVSPIQREELLARLRVGQRHLELQQDFLTALETLQQQAMQDELTGLLNRRAFTNRLESEIQRAIRHQSGLAIMMADLDHFKDVNDTHGHLVGDIVLAESALRLGSTMRAFDIIGRYGGEEFAMCVPLTSDADVRAVCERARKAISARPIAFEGGELAITISIGCVVVEKVEEGLDMGAALDRADAALYAAKRTGRNRCIIRNLRLNDDTVVSIDE